MYYETLLKLKDERYALFHQKLLKNDEIKVIGIRTPELKKIAKNIAQNDYMSFLNNNPCKYYEEVVLYGLVITYLDNFDEAIILFEKYIDYIDNWASCDIVVANFKLIKKNKEKMLKHIKRYINSKNSWHIRVGLVLLLTYYIEEDYLDLIYNISNSIKSDDYYVKMANAWLISICLIKYYDKTIKFLKTSSLDIWTYNKALQKGIESQRIIDKEALRKLKKV